MNYRLHIYSHEAFSRQQIGNRVEDANRRQSISYAWPPRRATLRVHHLVIESSETGWLGQSAAMTGVRSYHFVIAV